ncbi:MAG: phenylacetate--CoA ligase, partial [Pseudomonadota bacterium]|nr:phenylacetate--CoA ligase [Pseudomonadota bacterium]
RAMRRMGKIVGRSDDMLIIRGVNLFPTQIEEIVLGHGQLSGQYQLVVTRQGNLDAIEVRCEMLPAHAAADRGDVALALKHRIKTLIGITTNVSVGLPDSLERTLVGKARRVIDRRNQ